MGAQAASRAVPLHVALCSAEPRPLASEARGTGRRATAGRAFPPPSCRCQRCLGTCQLALPWSVPTKYHAVSCGALTSSSFSIIGDGRVANINHVAKELVNKAFKRE